MTRTDALIAVASIAMLAACSGSDGLARVSGPDPVTAPSITVPSLLVPAVVPVS